MKTQSFDYSPSKWVPYKNLDVIRKVREIRKDQLTNHPNPDFNIKIVKDDMIEFLWVSDMFYRIKDSSDNDRQLVLILPNPAHCYKKVAHLINMFKVNCKNIYTFIMDEYADEKGNIAPESFPQSFMRAFKNYFYYIIDEELRPPLSQVFGPTNKNLKDYGKMIQELGNADACYSGPGWTGHLAFIEPDAPEFNVDFEEWKNLGPRIVTLSPFTIAQNSLHGSFGLSGDISLVPPRAATIGPKEVISSKYRMDMHALTTGGTNVSWQRFISRLCLHGEITSLVPQSILQTLKTDVFISETMAMDIEPYWDMGY
jgi:glucosamine-6-phosphate deaminase